MRLPGALLLAALPAAGAAHAAQAAEATASSSTAEATASSSTAEATASSSTAEATARAALEDARYAEALELLEGVTDPSARARLRADVLWYARDFEGVLETAEAAANARLSGAHLAWRAAGAALWLRRPEAAERWALALEGAVAVGAGVGAGEEDWWLEQATSYRTSAAELESAARRRTAAGSRARNVALGTLAAALLAVVGLAARAGRPRTPADPPRA